MSLNVHILKTKTHKLCELYTQSVKAKAAPCSSLLCLYLDYVACCPHVYLANCDTSLYLHISYLSWIFPQFVALCGSYSDD